jgi:hypothetical protein
MAAGYSNDIFILPLLIFFCPVFQKQRCKQGVSLSFLLPLSPFGLAEAAEAVRPNGESVCV